MNEINNKFDNIKELNKYLIDNNYKIQLIEYVKYAQLKFNKDIDISFMDYFLEICSATDKFLIHHDKLKEYGVINNINTSAKIKRGLEQFNLIENKDFGTHGGNNIIVYHLLQSNSTSSSCGATLAKLTRTLPVQRTSGIALQ